MKLTYFIYLQLTICWLIKHFTVIYSDADKQFLTLNLNIFLPRKNLPIWDPKLPTKNCRSPYLRARKDHMYDALFVCLCWGLTSQSTIFQSCRDGATASWVINQYFRGVKCLAQGHNTVEVGFEPQTSRFGVRHSTTEPPRSPHLWCLSTANLSNVDGNR